MRELRVEINDETVYLPVPTRFNKVARVIYQALLFVVAWLGVVTLTRTSDPLAWYGALWMIAPIPAFYFVERAIKRIQWNESKAVRGLLLGAEMIIPLFVMQVMPASSAILHAFGLSLTTKELALTLTACMLVIGLGGVPANYTWARNKLGLER